MAEYIEREHLARLLTEDIEIFGEENSSAKPIAYGTVMGLKAALRYVNGVGAADVVEVRHGEWDWYPDRMDRQELLCTNCEEPAPYNDGEQIRTLYCPNCGAKMDGKDGAK